MFVEFAYSEQYFRFKSFLTKSGSNQVPLNVPYDQYDVLISSRSALKQKFSNITIAPSGYSNIDYYAILGDIDQDNYIGFDDFDLMGLCFNMDISDPFWHQHLQKDQAGTPDDCDLDRDGFVGFDDFDFIANNFNSVGDTL